MIWNEILQWVVLLWLVFRVYRIWESARSSQALAVTITQIISNILGGDNDDKQD